jgi:Fe(3+) dicitrate transport protein
MSLRYVFALFLSTLFAASLHAQQAADSTPNATGYLDEVAVKATAVRTEVQPLPEVLGTAIYAGKKTAIVHMDRVQGNVVTNTMRQVLAKVPGIHVWESDASGIQIGVAARGLSPNRSWEFNVRQNGYDISADPFGYPEAYYNPPLQAVQRIQVVRGAGSLQYGPQFGGMINYVLRDGSDIRKPFEFQTIQTAGSFGLFNSFNAVGGSTKKLHYYAFYDHRQGGGWRDNSRYRTGTAFATLNYRLTNRLAIGGELMRYDMHSQQAGGLTDAAFAQDAQQSTRARNWFSTPWWTAAANAAYAISQNSRVNLRLFSMWGDRLSTGFLAPQTASDTVNARIGTQNHREVMIDKYRNWGAEARYATQYALFGREHTFSTGLRGYHGDTYRLQRGKGTTGSDEDYSIVEAQFPNDLHFSTSNGAAFAENLFRLTDRLSFIPGLRYEYVTVDVAGRMGFRADGSPINIMDERRTRSFLLAGAGAEYHIGAHTEVYANWSQAYRPMLFSDLSALPTTDVIDPALKDARGYNLDLGYRGTVKDWLLWDVSAFLLQYNNRIGAISQQRTDGSFYNFRTNVGGSRSRGVEALVEVNPVKAIVANPRAGDVSLFVSYAHTDARYGAFRVVTRNSSNELVESTLEDKRVENAPEHILRTGATYHYKGVELTYQVSHVSAAFSNANNTETPTADGNNGLIPAYTVQDLTVGYSFKRYTLRAGVNNLADARYFTRRAGGYPGPGLLPADGRTGFVSVGARF